MDLRLTIEDFTRLHDFAAKWNTTKSDVIKKAERKWNRLEICLPVEQMKKNECSTLKLSIKIRNHESAKSPDELRQIIQWYINEQEAKERTSAPLDLDKCKHGHRIVNHEQYERGMK